MRNLLARIAGRAVERPTPVIVAAVLVALIGAVGALKLEADRSPDSLVDKGSSTYAETQDFYKQFGAEPVEVLVKGDLRQLLLTSNLGKLLALESCLSGKAKGGQVYRASRRRRRALRSRSSIRALWCSGRRPSSTSSRSRPTSCYGQQAQATLAKAQQAGRRAAALAAEDGAIRRPSSSRRRRPLVRRVVQQFEQQMLAARGAVRAEGPPAA